MEEKEKVIQDTIDKHRAYVFCATCGEVFLDLPLKDYIALRSPARNDWTPDKFYVETGIHWATHPGHEIIGCLPLPQKISDIWEARRARDDLTREAMLPHFYRHREEVKHKPI
jgi:hypothetical protein